MRLFSAFGVQHTHQTNDLLFQPRRVLQLASLLSLLTKNLFDLPFTCYRSITRRENMLLVIKYDDDFLA